MRRTVSAMGSSKYEFNPEGLDSDYIERQRFLSSVVSPTVNQMIGGDNSRENLCKIMQAVKEPEFLLCMLSKLPKDCSFRITHEGVFEFCQNLIFERSGF